MLLTGFHGSYIHVHVCMCVYTKNTQLCQKGCHCEYKFGSGEQDLWVGRKAIPLLSFDKVKFQATPSKLVVLKVLTMLEVMQGLTYFR